MTAADLLLASIRTTIMMPVENYADRNPRLVRHWRAAFRHEYQLPKAPKRPDPLLNGTSSDTAVRCLEQVAHWPRLTTMGATLFLGGIGHCYPQPQGHYPIEVRAGFLHFYQNLLPWSRYAKAFIFDFFSRIMFAALTQPELDQYKFAAFPDRDIFPDFRTFFTAFIENGSVRLQPFNERYGALSTMQRLEVVKYLFQPSILAQRAPLVANYRFHWSWDKIRTVNGNGATIVGIR